jgi:uncharacterized protein YndB with AHSA1/START domain
MSTENNPAPRPTPGNMELVHVFNAPRALVFKAWTDPAQLAQWWGPHGFTNPRCEWDVRPGGLIHVDMRGPNGIVYPMTGAYREIVEPERLVFTGGALGPNGNKLFDILNIVTFAEKEGRTTVTLRTEVLDVTAEARPYLNGQKQGWGQSIERLDAFIETRASDRELVISREFDAPRELVWEAMTDPAQVVQWWGPRGFTTTIQEMDVRPGGVWEHIMHGPDGTDYPNKSIFSVVEKPARIVYTHGGARKGGPEAAFEATWTFEALDENKTRATIRMVFPSAEARETVIREYGAVEGGHQTLGRLAEMLDATPLVLERTFDAPIETVWKAISETGQMKHWYFEIENFAAEPGREFHFDVEHEGMTYCHRCKVTEVIPGKKLAYTWRYAGHEGDSLVTFELFPAGSKTKLKLTHEGLNTFPGTPQFARRNFIAGWTSLVGTCLREYLEKKT